MNNGNLSPEEILKKQQELALEADKATQNTEPEGAGVVEPVANEGGAGEGNADDLKAHLQSIEELKKKINEVNYNAELKDRDNKIRELEERLSKQNTEELTEAQKIEKQYQEILEAKEGRMNEINTLVAEMENKLHRHENQKFINNQLMKYPYAKDTVKKLGVDNEEKWNGIISPMLASLKELHDLKEREKNASKNALSGYNTAGNGNDAPVNKQEFIENGIDSWLQKAIRR